MSSGWTIVGGAPKCGTTSLYFWLADHPDVCPSRIKEARYFIDPEYPLQTTIRYGEGGDASYEDFFSHCPQDKHRLEATPDYLYQQIAIEKIPLLDPSPHVVFSIRRPSRRIFSVFQSLKHHERIFDRSLEFREFVDRLLDPAYTFDFGVLDRCLDQSRYVRWLEPWREAMDPGRLHIFVFEDLVRDVRASAAMLAERVGLDPSRLPPTLRERVNETARVRSRSLQKAAVRISNLASKRQPDSTWHRVLKLYRAVNIVPQSRPSPNDVKVMSDLDHEFEEDNRRLAAAFGLDLASWTPTPVT